MPTRTSEHLGTLTPRQGRGCLTRFVMLRWRLWTVLVVAVLVAVALSLMTTAPAAQQDGSATQAGTSIVGASVVPANPDPPGTIDGAKNPEKIPDDVAYELLFLAVAEPENATQEQMGRAESKIEAAGLNEDDRDAFLNALTQFRKGVDQIDAQLVEINKRSPLTPAPSPDGQLVGQLQSQRRQLVADTISLLGASLSPEGLAKLHEHLQREKRGMKLIPMNLPAGY